MKKLVFLLVLVALYALGLYFEMLEPVSTKKNPKIVFISPGTPVKEVAELLEREGLIRNKYVFLLEAARAGVLESLKAGEYELSPHMSVRDIIKVLHEGRVVTHIVTIPEGSNIWDVARLLAKSGLVKRKQFIKKALDEEVAKSFGIPGPTVEGFLFPDTYFFVKGMSVEDIMKRMVNRFWEVWKKYEGRAEELGLSVYEVVTLASIVEKEAVLSREKPLIAAVYWNRLKRGMPLQADPTVRYALRRFRGKLYYKHLRVRNPYNTYRYPGLPPTPISNPGEESIRAVLYPAKVPYLYFVSKGDGSHYFSTTYREHLRAIRKYRRRR